MKPALFSHPSQNYPHFSLACTLLEHVSNSVWLSVTVGLSNPTETGAVFLSFGFPTAPKAGEIHSDQEVSRNVHSAVLEDPVPDSGAHCKQPASLECSSQWNGSRKCFWCLDLIVDRLWEPNYRIYTNSKRYIHKNMFKIWYKNILKKQAKKILLNDLTLRTKTSYLSDKSVKNKKQATA